MPRVKIDYVVSFSSESSDAPASNLLVADAGRGRWLCAKGEPSCSVLLQLSKAVQISSITIGAHLAALVEVLVGRSETPSDQYKVLIASSVFLSPPESRKASEGDSTADRVRSFSADQLSADARDGRWDRVRVVCSQPYNKHCKYGLSFIHIFSPEADVESPAPPAPEPRRPVPTKAALKMPVLSPECSDDDEFKPGALFAQHRAKAQGSGSTDSQIRQATSQALKHQSDSSAKIVRTPISKPKGEKTDKGERQDRADSPKGQRADRHRDSLLYAGEDSPHDKIDRVVAAHKDQVSKTAEKAKEDEKRRKDKEKERDKDRHSSKEKHDADSTKHKKDKSRDEYTSKDKHRSKTDDSHRRSSGDYKKDSRDTHRKDNRHTDRHDDSHRRDRDKDKDKDSHGRDKDKNTTPHSSKRDRSSSKKDDDRSSKKQKVNKDDSGECLYAGPVSSEPHTLLSDVEFVISGYENPRRADVRTAALAMGAKFHRDWGPKCTHLICAFPNTPKLKSVRSSPDGHKAVVVTAEWVEGCARRQRRLPWQWFATERAHRVTRARSASGEDPPGPSRSTDPQEDTSSKCEEEDSSKKTGAVDSECDTDDEIERVMQANAKKRQASTDSDEYPSKKPKQRASEDAANCSRESDVAFVKDERVKGSVTVSDLESDATDAMEDTIEEVDLSSVHGLPAFFEGSTFAVGPGAEPLQRAVKRYLTAYGGEVVEPQPDEELEVDYVVCLSGDGSGAPAKGRLVRGEWVWACHERGHRCSPRDFAVG